jgi:hypothetical protein
MSKKWIQTTIQVPGNFTQDQKQKLGEMVIEKIQENTDSSKDRYGNSFPKYSKEYKDSLDFKNAGKTSKVNLRLTGDMMASIDIISLDKSSITIGYPSSSDLAGQVEGVQKDQNRPFLGLPAEQLNLIIAKVTVADQTTSLLDTFKSNLISNILGKITNKGGNN